MSAALSDALGRRLTGRVVLVGIGNPVLGDDAAGGLVARGVRGTPGIDVVESDDVPERDVLRIVSERPDVVVLVDAVDLHAPPGSVAVLEPDHLTGYLPTTHRVPLSLIATLIRRTTAADVFVLGIQPGKMTPGVGVSPEVNHSVDVLVQMLRRGPRSPSSGHRAVPC
jgi:hydrogenase maturation protease